MDRRDLYKKNDYVIGKGKQNVARARAEIRAAQQDAQRELESVEDVIELPHLERLKVWCTERNRRREKQLNKKPFASATQKYTELSKQNRRVTPTRKINGVRNSPVPVRNVATVARNNSSARQTPTEGLKMIDHQKSIRTETYSLLNRTFDKEDSIDTSVAKNADQQFRISLADKETSKNIAMVADDHPPVSSGTVEADFSDEYTATQKSPFSSGAFEPWSQSKQSNKRRKRWSKCGQLELTRSINDSPLVPQTQEAAKFFRFQVDSETTSLMESVQLWTERKDHLDAAYLEDVEVAIGQSKALIDQQFKFFLDLCEKCESETSQPPVRPSELEQFWRTAFAEVEECRRNFQKLETLKDTQWVDDLSKPAPDTTDQTKMKKNKKTAARTSETDVAHTVPVPRKTPMRLAAVVANRNIVSPAATPKSAVAKRKTSKSRSKN